MTFLEAIQTCIGKYAEFTGVARRSEFWWWTLFTALVAGALGVFSVVPVGDGSLGGILSGLWAIAVLLPSLAVLVRRLRDAGYPWQNVFWLLVPIAGLIVLVIYLTKPSTTPASS